MLGASRSKRGSLFPNGNPPPAIVAPRTPGYTEFSGPPIKFGLGGGRLTRLFSDRSLPGSWDFVIRGRRDAARDVHVDHLRDYLMSQ